MKCPICDIVQVEPEEDGKIPDCERCCAWLAGYERAEQETYEAPNRWTGLVYPDGYVPLYGDLSMDDYVNALD